MEALSPIFVRDVGGLQARSQGQSEIHSVFNPFLGNDAIWRQSVLQPVEFAQTIFLLHNNEFHKPSNIKRACLDYL